MAIKNEAKYETLKYIQEYGIASGREIAAYREVTHGCQSTLLRRYWKFGYLRRCSGEGKEKLYFLSDRGHDKLEWLETEFGERYDDVYSGETFRRCYVKREEDILDILRNIKRCKVNRIDKNYIVVESSNEDN